MAIWDVFLGNLSQMGFFQFLLPFLLVLAIVYGILRFAAKDILDKVDKTICGWLFCGEDDVIKDVEISGMFAEDKEKEDSIKETHEVGKERFENAKRVLSQ